jgi:RecA/RadA recombinase
MAKKLTSKGEFSFDDLNKELAKTSSLGSVMEISEFSEIDRYIHTGNYHLNACMTGSIFKGYPSNRSLAVAGPSGTGKTYLILNGVKNFQDEGYKVIYFDSENAVDKELMKKFNIDTNEVRYEPIGTVEEFRTVVTQTCQTLIDAQRAGYTIPRILFVLDSAGNLASKKEIDDAMAGSDKADMTRSKKMKSIFRIIMNKMAEIKATFIFSNHVYMTQDFYPEAKAGGGCLIPGSKVIMGDGTLKNIEDINKGDFVSTLDGSREILNIWEFEKPIYEIEFEDGSIIKCSEDHRFFTGGDYLNDDNWITAKNIAGGEEVIKIK